MTNRAAFLSRTPSIFTYKCHIYECQCHGSLRTSRNDLNMFIVWKSDGKIRLGVFTLRRLVEDLTRIWERMPRTVTRRRICMANRTDLRRCTLKELLLVAIQAGWVLWIFGHIGKGGGAGSYLVPVFGWKFMACAALDAVSGGVMGKLRVPCQRCTPASGGARCWGRNLQPRTVCPGNGFRVQKSVQRNAEE